MQGKISLALGIWLAEEKKITEKYTTVYKIITIIIIIKL